MHLFAGKEKHRICREWGASPLMLALSGTDVAQGQNLGDLVRRERRRGSRWSAYLHATPPTHLEHPEHCGQDYHTLGSAGVSFE